MTLRVGIAAMPSSAAGVELVRQAERLGADSVWVPEFWAGDALTPLAFLAAPFVYAVPVLVGNPLGAVVYVGFLAWVCYAISFLVRRHRVNIPRAVISFIAGISLLDALLIARAGHPLLAGWGVLGFVLTLGFQRWVKGT